MQQFSHFETSSFQAGRRQQQARQVTSSVPLTGGSALVFVLFCCLSVDGCVCVCDLLGRPSVHMQIFLWFLDLCVCSNRNFSSGSWFSALQHWPLGHKCCRCCCLSPASSSIAVYGWGVVAESPESAHLPLIDDTICGSLPVRALNFGRGAVWPRELPVHLRTARSDVFVGGERRRGSLYSRAVNLKRETLIQH